MRFLCVFPNKLYITMAIVLLVIGPLFAHGGIRKRVQDGGGSGEGLPFCGDGLVEPGEACEPPLTATCDSQCQLKEQPCAVTNITFEQFDAVLDASNPPTHGGGWRVFPEKPAPDQAVRQLVRVRVVLDRFVPAEETRQVHVEAFDIDHFSNTSGVLSMGDQTNFDPNGLIDPGDNIAAGGTLSFGGAPKTFNTTVTAGNANTAYLFLIFDHQPGNNWRFAAACEDPDFLGDVSVSGGTLTFREGLNIPNGMVSPVLTVWRTLHVEVDHMDSVDFKQGPEGAWSVHSGNITAGAGTATVVTDLNLSIEHQFGIPSPSVQQGSMTVEDCGLGCTTLAIKNVTANGTGAASTVTMSSASPVAGDSFDPLVDDDADHLENPKISPRPPDTTLMSNNRFFRAACVQVNFTTASTMGFNDADVPFDLNVGDGFTWPVESAAVLAAIEDTSLLDTGKDLASEDDYWVTYLLGAYQGRWDETGDGQNPAAPGSAWTTGIQSGGGPILQFATSEVQAGAIIYLESVRDQCSPPATAFCTNATVLEQEVVVHEVAHGFGSQHGDMGVMGSQAQPIPPSSGGPGNSEFSGLTLRRIISSNHPGFDRNGF